MNRTRSALTPLLFSLLGASALGAQTLEEICPNSADGTGAMWGLLSDLDADMGLPGATVRATWEVDGTPGSAEAQTALDGSFTMCYLPLGTELSVVGLLGSMPGQPVTLTLAEPITRQDIGFSLTGGTEEADAADKIWGCFGQAGSQARVQLGALLRCDPQWQPLEQCPKQELGRVSATMGTRGRGAMREMIERLTDEARRMGANALIRFGDGRGSINAMAVLIEVDPSTC